MKPLGSLPYGSSLAGPPEGSGQQQYVVAVDGGQSSTIALVATLAGEIAGVGHGGPSNHYHEPGGPQRLESALRDSLAQAMSRANVEPAGVSHACLGLSGGPAEALIIGQAILPRAEISVRKDYVTGLAGATSGAMSGVLVIAGTGSVAYGCLPDGTEALAGGWGYMMGDEGSAYDVGIRAMRAAACAGDGRGPATSLTFRVPEQLGMPDLRAVHEAVYSHRLSRADIAGLARAVCVAAADGDPVSGELLAGAGVVLARAAAAVIHRLGRQGLQVYPVGGLFAAGIAVAEPFASELSVRCPGATVCRPAFGPAAGALFLALHDAGVSLKGRVLANVHSTWHMETTGGKPDLVPPPRAYLPDGSRLAGEGN